MALGNFSSNQGTQTPIVVDTVGGGSVMAMQKLDISPLGASGTPWLGGVTGTINAGSITVIAGTIASDTIVGGTLNLAQTVSTVSMLSAGTLTTIPNIPGGTLGLVTTITNLSNGTIQNSGTVTGVGSVSSLGSLGMLNAGTITTLPNVPGGTLGLVTTVTNLSNGTIQNSGTVTGVGTVSNIGSLGMLNAGTITSLPNIPGGTIGSVLGIGSVSGLSNLPQGSIQVTAGTFRGDARTTQNIITYGTSIGSSGAVTGTIVGSASVGAGTSLWVNDFSIMNNNGNVTCILGFGTAQQGTNVLFRGSLGTAGAIGIQKPYPRAVNAGMTNQDLVFSTSGAGTVDLSVSYFISA